MSDETNVPLDQEVNENTEVTETTETPEPEFVEAEKYQKVLKETMKRKQQIKELQTQLHELAGKSSKADEATESAEKYKRLLAEKDKQINELRYKGKLRNSIAKFNPVSDRVAELAFNDANAADVLDNEEELENFLKTWKADNAPFFKTEATIATSPQPKAQVEEQPEKATDVDAFRQMSREQRRKMPKSQFDKLMSQLDKQS